MDTTSLLKNDFQFCSKAFVVSFFKTQFSCSSYAVSTNTLQCVTTAINSIFVFSVTDGLELLPACRLGGLCSKRTPLQAWHR